MKIILHITVLATIFINSCQSQPIKNEFRIQFKDDIDLFPVDITNHFPKSFDSNYFSYTTNVNEIANKKAFGGFIPITFYLTCKYTKSEFTILKDSINDLCINTISALDTNILLIFSYFEEDNYFPFQAMEYNPGIESESLKTHNKFNADKFPLPVFNIIDYKDTTTITRLRKDFVIYGIEAKPGKFQQSNYLSNSEYLPDKWRHGFSRGYAISNKEFVIVYWLVIW